jgi:hypothetical protein
MSTIRLSPHGVAHDEGGHLERCLKTPGFADERITVLDPCSGGPKPAACSDAARLIKGAWKRE